MKILYISIWLKRYLFEPLAICFSLISVDESFIFVILTAKRTWENHSQCRLAKYNLSNNWSSLCFICILFAVVHNFQGSQLIQPSLFFFFFPSFSLQAALIPRWDDILHMCHAYMWILCRFGQSHFLDVCLHSLPCLRLIKTMFRFVDLLCFNQLFIWKDCRHLSVTALVHDTYQSMELG